MAMVDLGWGDAQYKNTITKDQEHRNELMVFADTHRGRMAQSYFNTPSLHRAVEQGSDLARRLARHLGIHLASSELTRQDQLRRGGKKETRG
jgi:CelD/BcsL family acetyltransferase involved in cellulose biosynthesis